jgi:thioredoxin reductase (NADPH)
MSDMREQAKRFGTEFISGEVTKIDLKKKPFTLTVGTEKRNTNTVIIATGASPKMLGLPEEKKVLVVGGGDTAMEEAIYLSTLAKNVTVIHRRDELRASKIMQERAKRIKNIHFTWDSVVEEIHDLQKNTVTGASIKNVRTGRVFLKECDGIFIGLGHIPNTDFLNNQLELDKNGFIVTRNGSKTSVPGVFAAGDVSDPVYKQAITSAGKGCMAALDAERFIQRLD